MAPFKADPSPRKQSRNKFSRSTVSSLGSHCFTSRPSNVPSPKPQDEVMDIEEPKAREPRLRRPGLKVVEYVGAMPRSLQRNSSPVITPRGVKYDPASQRPPTYVTVPPRPGFSRFQRYEREAQMEEEPSRHALSSRMPRTRVVAQLDVSRFPRDQYGEYLGYGVRYIVGSLLSPLSAPKPIPHFNQRASSSRKLGKATTGRVTAMSSLSKRRPGARAANSRALPEPKSKMCGQTDCSNMLTRGVQSALCDDCRKKFAVQPLRSLSPDPDPANDSYVDYLVPLRDPSDGLDSTRESAVAGPSNEKGGPSSPVTAAIPEIGQEGSRTVWRGRHFDFDGTTWRRRSDASSAAEIPSLPVKKDMAEKPSSSPVTDSDSQTPVQNDVPLAHITPSSPSALLQPQTVALPSVSDGSSFDVAQHSGSASVDGGQPADSFTPTRPEGKKLMPPPPARRLPVVYTDLAEAIMQAHTPMSPSAFEDEPAHHRVVEQQPSPKTNGVLTDSAEKGKTPVNILHADAAPANQTDMEAVKNADSEMGMEEVGMETETAKEKEPEKEEVKAVQGVTLPIEYMRSTLMWDDIKKHVNQWRTQFTIPKEKYFYGFYEQIINPAVVTAFPVSSDAIQEIAREFATYGDLVFNVDPILTDVGNNILTTTYDCMCTAHPEKPSCDGVVKITVEPTTGHYAIKAMRVTLQVSHTGHAN